MRENKIDFAVLTETWFTERNRHLYESSELNTFGYKLKTVNRLCGDGGGIALVHKDF